MSKPPPTPIAIPAPPPALADEITHIPSETHDTAVAWLASHGMPVTVTYLRNARVRGELTGSIVCGRVLFSRAELYRFAVTRPKSKRNNGRKTR